MIGLLKVFKNVLIGLYGFFQESIILVSFFSEEFEHDLGHWLVIVIILSCF